MKNEEWFVMKIAALTSDSPYIMKPSFPSKSVLVLLQSAYIFGHHQKQNHWLEELLVWPCS